MDTIRYKIAPSLLVVFVLAFLYVQQNANTASQDSRPDDTPAAEINTRLQSPEPNVQETSTALAVANLQSGDNSTGANNGTISLDEILNRAAISTDNNVFPQQYRVDIATTALLTDAISRLDKDKLELHVFSAECYEALNECRVHYQASDSLVLHLMASFAGMSQIFDHATESGDTVLMIRYTPVGAANDSGTDN